MKVVKNMKIWIVLRGTDSFCRVAEVFDNADAANNYVKHMIDKDGYFFMDIKEWEVNSECEWERIQK